MTEKRYVLYNRKDMDYILDNPKTHLDFIEMLGDALTSEEIVNLLNEQDTRIRELERINNICEEQITELRRLVHIVTNNNFIKKSKKEEWKKELMKE